MDIAVDDPLYRRTWDLLQPGDIELNGLVVHTDLDGSTETEMHQATVELGELIATYAGYDPGETFVYSGTNDSEFASNQHQGLTLEDESFVWECQQLLRDGSFDLVFYFEADADADGLLAAVHENGYDAVLIRGQTADPESAVETPATKC